MAINRNGTATASNERACLGSLAAHLDKFAEFLAGEGYVSQTIKDKCALVAALSRWLERHRVPLTKLNEARLKQFHAHRSGSRRRGDVYTACQLLEFLRRLGVVDIQTTSIYLQADMQIKEQALAKTTATQARVSRYRPPDRVLAFLNTPSNYSAKHVPTSARFSRKYSPLAAVAGIIRLPEL